MNMPFIEDFVHEMPKVLVNTGHIIYIVRRKKNDLVNRAQKRGIVHRDNHNTVNKVLR